MVMPFLTVTAIGVLIGGAGYVIRRGEHALWRGFFGAWAGFATGATAGLLLDVATGSGHWVPLLGHVTAVAAAVLSQWVETSVPGQR